MSIQSRDLRPSKWLNLKALWIAFGGVALFAPYFFPVTPSLSESYGLGYSNFGFLVILVVEISVVFFLVKIKFSPLVSARISNDPIKDGNVAKQYWVAIEHAWRIFRILAIVAIVTQFAFLLVARNGLSDYGEVRYFIQRAQLIDLGKVPYRDFEYAYGYFLLYCPWFIFHLTHISFSFSLMLAYSAELLIGYACLYYITVVMFGRTTAKYPFMCLVFPTLFSVFAASQNYTFFRFALPLALAIFLFKRASNYAERVWPLSFAVLVTFVAAFFISPEISLTITLALMGTSLLRYGRDFRLQVAFLGTTMLIFAVLLWAWPGIGQSLLTMLSFAKGGNNFPVFPSLHIIVTLYFIGLSVLLISNIAFKGSEIFYLVFAYSLLNLPGGFGRCDFEHTFFYLFGFFLLGLKYLEMDRTALGSFRGAGVLYASINTLIAAIYMAAYGMVPLGIMVLNDNILNLSENQKQYILAHVPARKKSQALTYLYPIKSSLPVSQYAGAFALDPNPTFTQDNAALFKYSYYASLQNASTYQAYETISREIGNSKYVITPFHFYQSRCGGWIFDPKFIGVLFLFPVGVFPQRHDPGVVEVSLCHKLAEYMDLNLATTKFSVLRRKIAAAPL